MNNKQQLDKAQTEMDKLLDLVMDKQLPLITFLEFIDKIEKTAQKKVIENIKLWT